MNPITLYAEAYQRFKEGDRKKAADLLGKAMGGEGTEILEDRLEKFFDTTNEIGKLTAHMVGLETVKQRWGKGL